MKLSNNENLTILNYTLDGRTFRDLVVIYASKNNKSANWINEQVNKHNGNLKTFCEENNIDGRNMTLPELKEIVAEYIADTGLNGYTEKVTGDISILQEDIVNVQKSLDTVDSRISTAIAKVVAEAPEKFDTLKEVADWIGTDTTDAVTLEKDVATIKNDYVKSSDISSFITMSDVEDKKYLTTETFTATDGKKLLDDLSDTISKASTAIQPEDLSDSLSTKVDKIENYTLLSPEQSLSITSSASDIDTLKNKNFVEYVKESYKNTEGNDRERDAIEFTNNTAICGFNTDKSTSYNIAMVNEWNIVDFGDKNTFTNINTSKQDGNDVLLVNDQDVAITSKNLGSILSSSDNTITINQSVVKNGSINLNIYDLKAKQVDISNKVDKSTTLSGYGIVDAKIEDGVITLGSNTITPITDISIKADKIVGGTEGNVITIDSTGNLADSGMSIGISVPSDAKFTDTVTTITNSNSGNIVTSITANNGELTINKNYSSFVYGGKNLLDYFSAEQLVNKITNEDFSDVYVGDYFDMTVNTSTVRWIVAGVNLFKNDGDVKTTTPHLALISKNCLYNVKMNTSEESTADGYVGSNIYNNASTIFEEIEKEFETMFGSNHIMTHRMLLSDTVTDGISSNYEWKDVTFYLPSEVEVFGYKMLASSNYDIGNMNQQIPLFALSKESICGGITYQDGEYTVVKDRYNWWLSSVANDKKFCIVTEYGICSSLSANSDAGIRPIVCLK